MRASTFLRLSAGLVLLLLLALGSPEVEVLGEESEPPSQPYIPMQSSMMARNTTNTGTDAWEWFEGQVEYTYVTGWTGIPGETGFGTYVAYYQNPDIPFPYVNAIYYIAVVVYGVSSPQWGTMSAYLTFILPPNTSLAIGPESPMLCFGGELPFQQFECNIVLEQLYPGVNQYAIPSGEYGNVWPIAAGAGWEFLIPVKTSTTLNNSTLMGEVTNVDGYQMPPKLYPDVPLYVFEAPDETPGAFGKYEPANGATGVEIYPYLSWYESANATSYSYCMDTSNDNACSNWISENTPVDELLPGTTYYWQIKAENVNGTTYADSSTFWHFTTKTNINPPAAFSKSTPTNGATGLSLNPTLSWNMSGGVVEIYEYCYDTSNDNACGSWFVLAPDKTSVNLVGLQSDTTYYWHVRARNYDGTTYSNNSQNAFWSFKTAKSTAPPAAFSKIGPTNTASNVSMNPILSWAATPDIQLFEYCFDTTDDGNCASWIDNGINTNVTLTDLFSNTKYYWQVRAVNDAGTTYANGTADAYWTFTTELATEKPGAFSKASPVNSATGIAQSPTLSWGNSSGATSYAYCYDKTNDNVCSSWVNVGTATSKALSGLSAGTKYYWQVRAINNIGTTYANGTADAFWTFTTVPVPEKPGAFSKTNPVNGATGLSQSPTLSWGSSSGTTSYAYCFDKSNDNACSNWVNVGTQTSKTLSGLTPGTKYYWHVRAVNNIGTTYSNGTATAFWSFTTKANVVERKIYLPMIIK